MKRLILVIVATLAGLASSLPVQAAHYQYSGNILTGAQFDTFPIFLRRGDFITATLVCDQVQGGGRPLDPVLSVFLPFDPAVDTAAAVMYNDDGFGLDDARQSVITAYDIRNARPIGLQGNYHPILKKL